MNLHFLSYFSGNRQDQYKYFSLIVYIGPFVYHFQYIACALLSLRGLYLCPLLKFHLLLIFEGVGTSSVQKRGYPKVLISFVFSLKICQYLFGSKCPVAMS